MPSEEKLLQNLGALCNMVRRTALEAGEIIMKYHDNLEVGHVDKKADNSPVTLADREAEKFIETALQNFLPGVLMIGEEDVAAGAPPDISKSEHFWLVDPLDGTTEFIRGGMDFTVNIALVRGNKSVLGVVYAPAKGELYAGCEGRPALRWLEDTDSEKEISVRRPPAEGLTVVASRSHGSQNKLEEYLQGFKVAKVIKRGSSLKICEIAAGKADLYPRLGPTCEWDTAAGHAVLSAAGGVLTDMKGAELTYGRGDPKFLNPDFVAASVNWLAEDEEQA